jgi:hypothetical protein
LSSGAVAASNAEVDAKLAAKRSATSNKAE